MKAIEAIGLTRNYNGLCAVDKVSFQVEAGEIFGFLGPNGAGKTTTIKMLTGQLRPSDGRAKVAGWDIVEQRDQLAAEIGVVFEFQNLYERLSARDNLSFFARIFDVSQTRVEDVLRLTGLEQRAKDKVKTYSNGMKQRLLIARGLLHEPKVLFLDEPTRGLDPGVARDIRDIIARLSDQGVTIFLTTHYMEEADRLCDQVAILDEGRIVAAGTPADLKTSYGKDEGSTLEDVFLTLTGRGLY